MNEQGLTNQGFGVTHKQWTDLQQENTRLRTALEAAEKDYRLIMAEKQVQLDDAWKLIKVLEGERDTARAEARKAMDIAFAQKQEISRLKVEAEGQALLIQAHKSRAEKAEAELAEAKKAAAPYVHEWALRLEDENRGIAKELAEALKSSRDYEAKYREACGERDWAITKRDTLAKEVERLKADLKKEGCFKCRTVLVLYEKELAEAKKNLLLIGDMGDKTVARWVEQIKDLQVKADRVAELQKEVERLKAERVAADAAYAQGVENAEARAVKRIAELEAALKRRDDLLLKLSGVSKNAAAFASQYTNGLTTKDQAESLINQAVEAQRLWEDTFKGAL